MPTRLRRCAADPDPQIAEESRWNRSPDRRRRAHIRTLIEQTLEELEDEGVELLTATNGDEALELSRPSGPIWSSSM